MSIRNQPIGTRIRIEPILCVVDRADPPDRVRPVCVPCCGEDRCKQDRAQPCGRTPHQLPHQLPHQPACCPLRVGSLMIHVVSVSQLIGLATQPPKPGDRFWMVVTSSLQHLYILVTASLPYSFHHRCTHTRCRSTLRHHEPVASDTRT